MSTPEGTPEGQQPSEEELRAALEEQMRNIRAGDVILQTTATLVNLAARRLGLSAEPGTDPSAEVDLADARLSIDGARALAPLCPPEQSEQIQQALSQLQMAFAQLSGPAGAGEQAAVPQDPPAPAGSGEPVTPPPAQPQQPSPEEEERAKARSKLWTPPGT